MRSYRRPTIDDDLGELAGIRAQALGPGPGKSTPGPVAAPRVTGPAPSPIVQPPPKVNPGSSPPPRTVVTAPGVYDPTPAPGGRRDGAPDLGDIAAGRGTLGGLPDAADDDIDGVIGARMAREEELRREKARALSAGAASAGLAGMGLSGASAARQSDIGRGQERSISTGLDEFDKQKAAEDFSAIQRLAAIADLEDATDKDVDGDGMIGGEKVKGKFGDGNPDNDPTDPEDEPGYVAPNPDGAVLSADGTTLTSKETAVADAKPMQVRTKKASGSSSMGTVDDEDGNTYDVFYDSGSGEVYVVARA